jgi:hypothetical protein
VQAECFPRPYPARVGPQHASRLAANPDALAACELLCAAYAEGKDGGSVPWETLNEAHALALKARAVARQAPELLSDEIDRFPDPQPQGRGR